jgi:hypothetical protein
MHTVTDGVPAAELYWRKEKICDIAFRVENQLRKTRNPNSRYKWLSLLTDILSAQKQYEQRLREVFGGDNSG